MSSIVSPFFWASRIIASKSMLYHHSSSTGRTNSFLNFYIYYIIFFNICQPDRKLVQKFSLRYGFLLGNSIYVVGYREFEVGNMNT
nr:MAG TPA: hypothetical protein [Caudoviricetes sp.]